MRESARVRRETLISGEFVETKRRHAARPLGITADGNDERPIGGAE